MLPDPAIVSVIKELFQDLYGSWRLTGYPTLVFGTTSAAGQVPPSLVPCFKHEVDFEARQILRFCVDRVNLTWKNRLLAKRRGRQS